MEGGRILKIATGSDSVIIVLHEIFGINEHIRGVCSEYSGSGYDIICPDFIKHKPFSFYQQEEAYLHFMMNIGFDTAFLQVQQLLLQANQDYRHVFLLGYSIGATIAWQCSGVGGTCDGVVGYYGSRIRDYFDIVPKCPVLLFFPDHEESFDVKKTAGLLKEKGVGVHVLTAKHGFCSLLSDNYSETSCRESKKKADGFLRKIISQA